MKINRDENGEIVIRCSVDEYAETIRGYASIEELEEDKTLEDDFEKLITYGVPVR